MNVIYLARTFTQVPSPSIDGKQFIIWLIIAAVLAIVFIIATIIAFLPHSVSASASVKRIHQSAHAYKQRIQKVEDDYAAHEFTKQQAYHELARIARDYASDKLDTDMSTQTLADLDTVHPHGDVRGITLLKQTIEGLYPPQFAYEATHSRSTNVTVAEACGWIRALIDKWEEQ
ncbi:hypothetical protein ACFQY8_05955 [Alloscardovia venturai]|uniref:Uncharacterized protein n=1 Tax=Alloscardovia venturai TaxID=1769421 RepID=A0ABW2Y4V1_9BIFI